MPKTDAFSALQENSNINRREAGSLTPMADKDGAWIIDKVLANM